MGNGLTRRLFSTWPILAGIFMLGFLLRFWCLDCYSIWYDEVASIEVAQRGLKALLTDRFGWMHVQTPLHYLQVWLTIQPLDPTASSLLVRLPSALAGSLTVLVVFALGREMFGRVQGLAAALMTALAIVHLDYSQDVRPYTVLTFLTALSVYFLLVAERKGSPRWWVAFGVASVLNILFSYNVLTLVLPALAPYCLWLFIKLLRQKKEGRKSLLYFLGAILLIGLVAVPSLIDMMQVPRTPPQLSPFPLSSVLNSPVELVIWFTRFDIGAQPEQLMQAVLLLFGFAGIGFGARKNARGVLLCVSMIAVPAAVLAILSTTNVVYQRYALFSMPFYLLLVANGFVATATTGQTLLGSAAFARALRMMSVLSAGVSLLVFLFAARSFLSGTDRPLIAIDRPDFRQAAAYLSESARPEDTIIFAGWDPTTSLFYWKDNPPADVYSILDPKLFNKKIQGSVYWVVSYDFDLPPGMVQSGRWSSVKAFYRTQIFRQDNPGSCIAPGMQWFAAQLEEITPRTRPVEHVMLNLKGSIDGGRGDAAGAAHLFRTAGVFFPIGGEYLRTSKEFASRGELAHAWRDALISKSMEPYSAELHSWMAELLSRMGADSQSRTEADIAVALLKAYHPLTDQTAIVK
ncbi:MAG TPA: glycosyltransferase family 39 protein [Chloroflexia bacterium]|nr:glycosyltransferase family 39 protein [Chloroflexia bacterium]